MSRFRGLLDARTRGLRRFVRLRSGAGGARALLRGAAGLALVPAFHGAVTPDAEAIVDGDRRLTWRDFDRRVRGLASGLRATYRLRPGDRGLLCLHNRLEVLETAAALHRLGVDVAFASPYGSDRELAETVGRIAPQLVVHDRAPMAPRPAQLPVGPAYEALAEGPSGPLPPVLRGPAVTLFTSGTTGLPKAVRRSVGGAPGAARLLEGVLEGLGAFWRIPMGPADRHLVLCPLHHLTGLGFALLTLAFGGTVVIAGRFDAARARALLIEERIDTAAVVPTMLRRLLDVDAPRPLLRALYSAGAPLTPELSRRAQEAFGPVLYNIYGATETGLNLVATPADLTAAPGTLGRALPGQRLRLVDDEGREVATGEVGELVVESAFLPEGDRRRATGDLLRRDAEGRYHVAGRATDLIISGGENVHPAEVERVLEAHPAIGEVAVVGVPDEEWGERVRAVVVVREGRTLTLEELRGWAKERLEAAKVPSELALVDALPRNPTGKILRQELHGDAPSRASRPR